MRRWAKRITAATLAVAAVYFGVLFLTGNIHTVVAGELYRSGTLSGDRLERLIRAHGIRTVVNLRGHHPELGWYRDEAGAVARSGARLIDLKWSSKRELTEAQVSRFYAAMAQAQRPILIHCESGADRTSLASALYLAKFAGADEETAEGQLSLRFGHLSLPYTRAYPMDLTFERLEPSLGYFGS